MKKFTLLLSVVLLALQVQAQPARVEQDEIEICTVEATQFAAGIGLIKFASVTYADYKASLRYAVAIVQGEDNVLGTGGWFTAAEGETGVTTSAILGKNLEAGEYTVYVGAYYLDDLYERGTATLVITDAATEELFKIYNLKATNSTDLSTTTISWSKTGTLSEGGYTVLQVYSGSKEYYNSLTAEGKVVLSSPVTLHLEKDRDYFIYFYVYLAGTTESSQYISYEAISHTVGTNPYVPVDLKAEVDGMHVKMTWSSSYAYAVPAFTTLDVYQPLSSTHYQLVEHVLIAHTEEALALRPDAIWGGQEYETDLTNTGAHVFRIAPYDLNLYPLTTSYYFSDYFYPEDNVAPVITDVKQLVTKTTSVQLDVTVTDNVWERSSLTFTVKNDNGEVLLQDVKHEDLIIEGLTANKTYYNLTITATDPKNNTSKPFTFHIKTTYEDEAPEIQSVTIDVVGDRSVTLLVEATDNMTPLNSLVFTVTLNGTVYENLKISYDGYLSVIGLNPATTYNGTITATDLAGNTSEAFAMPEFTTEELQPIVLNVEGMASTNLGDGHYLLNLYGSAYTNYLPSVYLDLYAADATVLSGTYSDADGSLGLEETKVTYVPNSDEVTVAAVAAEVTVTFVQYQKYGTNYFPVYEVEFSIIGEDGNRYIGIIQQMLYTCDSNGDYEETITGEPGYPATGLETTVQDSDNQPAYNALGQRVDATYKGIVIKNGKKVLVR